MIDPMAAIIKSIDMMHRDVSDLRKDHLEHYHELSALINNNHGSSVSVIECQACQTRWISKPFFLGAIGTIGILEPALLLLASRWLP